MRAEPKLRVRGWRKLALFATVMVVLSTTAFAGDEIFSWRDKEGVLHFSSTPPSPEDTVDGKGVKALNVAPQGKQGVGIRQRDGAWYCGKRQMRLGVGNASASLPAARSMLSQLLAEKKRAAKAYEALLVSIAKAKLKPPPKPGEKVDDPGSRRSAFKSHLDEVNCEVRWVRRQISELARADLKTQVIDKGISDRIKKLKKQKRSYCKANIDQMTAEQSKRYRSCVENFEKEIASLQKQLSS